jgi:hypothetical protein
MSNFSILIEKLTFFGERCYGERKSIGLDALRFRIPYETRSATDGGFRKPD